MAKNDTHKNLASNMIKDLVGKQDKTPQQQIAVKPKIQKRDTTKFTVEIDTELMDELRIYGATNKIKLRQIFEQALANYLKSNS
jgi:hypothetical protein